MTWIVAVRAEKRMRGTADLLRLSASATRRGAAA
jgi:hypothetical protein